ncbi:hypothetical protein O6H91_06G137800 [Diphasiastrum complanatum]|uniref:Uncharacterized protein n=1 Tax=Diphasiastrum complanatum TaxID=34168 RepID=A0ACC2DJR3_DIPCM|nr:hypothetical protein O6H91_06G137800 [Diphasiastrum complanatum]
MSRNTTILFHIVNDMSMNKSEDAKMRSKTPVAASAPATASASATATPTPSASTPHGSTASTAAPTPVPPPSDLHSPSTSSASAPTPMPPPPDPHRPSTSSQPSTSRGTRQMSMMGSFREGQHTFPLSWHHPASFERLSRKLQFAGPATHHPQPTHYAALCSRSGLHPSERD